MPNVIDANGLQVKTQAELVSEFTTAMQAIYGSDIDLSSDSPDGQMMMIFIQAVLDLEDLLVQIYNMFDPDNAIGAVLDQRVAINGIQRQAGTHTITNVTITVSQALNLYGLDQSAQPVFTVADNAGNEWELQQTQTIGAPGSYSYAFQAKNPGAVLTVPNTITVPVTIVLGVTTINNPSPATSIGLDEETDAVLKVRRQRSVSLASQGYLAGLLAELENINGVTSAFVYENTASATDGDGVPGHSIWVIIAGTAADADVAQAIYSKRNAGCGMKGDQTYVITQADGSPFIVAWDVVVTEPLFITFNASSIDGVNAPNIAAIRAQLPELFAPGVFEEVDINHLATDVQSVDPNTLVTLAGFSLAQTQTADLSGIPASGSFKIRYNGNDSAAINWNDSTATVETKVQAVPGLSACQVTGNLALQQLVFDLSAINPIQGLISVVDNTLQTVAPAAITFSFDEDFAETLEPSSKNRQFTVAEENIIILPMILSPATATVAALATKTFTGLGGYGEMTYSFVTNNSGGSINASSGLYTAGAVQGVYDTIKAVDAFGNSAQSVILVN